MTAVHEASDVAIVPSQASGGPQGPPGSPYDLGSAFGRPSDSPTSRPRRSISPAQNVVSIMLMIFAALLLGFAVYVGFLSRLHHDHAQYTSYADFRVDLANGTAPTDQTQPKHPKKLLDLGTPVAVLNIPELKLKEVVFEGTTSGVLENGPGHVRNSSLPGQPGISEIMGRSTMYGGPFGKLRSLSPGDTFTVTTGRGVQRFTVLDTRSAGDPQPPPVAAGKSRLILATADGRPFAPAGVFRVDADLTSEVQPGAPNLIPASDISSAEKALGIDASAWYMLVLWGQALLMSAIAIAWARLHWGSWQVWMVGVPVLGYFGLAVADQVARLLPNLM